MEYEDQLFEIFYESQVRQKIELDEAHRESKNFRCSVRKHFKSWRRDNSALWILVERDSQPLAFAVTDYNTVTRGFGIGNLGVASKARRQGVGEELMRRVIAKAKAMGAVSVGLTVHKNNSEARALYEKVNFKYEQSSYLDMILEL